jgi:UDP-N-acetyl-D-glucosamine/UDP-N-acetyl-D-galactosamine dehydrogenase
VSKIGIIGLGYVGLPLAVAFCEKYSVVGFDISSERVSGLNVGFDSTEEIGESDLREAFDSGLTITSDPEDLSECEIYIITVPTPVDKVNRPDISLLLSASELVGQYLKKNDLVIYESTVYPGATEEDCVPVLESSSGLMFNVDFYCGYSPERINPGDKKHTIRDIKKVTSGSNSSVAEQVDTLYKSVITAGTYLAPSIKVAEAAKVIENAQRDINIAFVNELAIIFGLLGIKTSEVLEAAASKWNFLPFKPGLVGGHCIGVDPFYLAHKSQQLGYYPEIILSGRRLNDGMGRHVAHRVIKLMAKKSIAALGSNLLVLGVTFKENCPDIRNSKVFDLIAELKSFGLNVDATDPWASKRSAKLEFGIDLLDLKEVDIADYSSVILAVAHDQFSELNLIRSEAQVIFDVKGVLADADDYL